jgi:hypothetical protein
MLRVNTGSACVFPSRLLGSLRGVDLRTVIACPIGYKALQLISYNFSANVANFVPNFVVKFKSS